MGKHSKDLTTPAENGSDVRDPYGDWFEAAKRAAVSSDDEAVDLSGITLEQILAEETGRDLHTVPAEETEMPLPDVSDELVSPAPVEPDPLPVIDSAEDLSNEFLADTGSVIDEIETADDTLPVPELPEEAPEPKKERSPKSSSSAKKKKRRKKKSTKKFRRGLRIYVIIVLALILALSAILWYFLSRFQAKKDAEAAEEAARLAEQAEQRAYEEALRRAPQLAFEDWLSRTDAAYWTDLWFEKIGDTLDQRDVVLSVMEDKFSRAEPFRSVEYTAEEPVYVLRDGDETLARIRLNGSDLLWSVTDVDLLVEGSHNASVTVSTGSRVFCNGVELGPEHAGTTVSSFSYEPLADKLVDPVGWVTYTVEGLLSEPELSAVPPEGQSITETLQGDFLICLNDGTEQAFLDRSVNFVRAYLFYYMSGYNGTWGNMFNALAYLVPGTNAYQTLYDTYNGVIWNTAYANIDTSNTHADSVVIWAQNCYSVDVTYDAKCTLNGQAIDYASATMRIYYLRGADGNFYISDFESL